MIAQICFDYIFQTDTIQENAGLLLRSIDALFKNIKAVLTDDEQHNESNYNTLLSSLDGEVC